ncbi:hypothetical protein FDU21_07190 [Xanthomonas oryzae pv. oryzae]|nr:hypothetical protein FDU21_07190 [Xanthomonas oryzae pv. oryzae]
MEPLPVRFTHNASASAGHGDDDVACQKDLRPRYAIFWNENKVIKDQLPGIDVICAKNGEQAFFGSALGL